MYPIRMIGSLAQSLAPLLRTLTATGSAVDLKNYDGCMVVVDAGTSTDGTHTISLESSEDNVTWAAVAAGDLLGAPPAITAANDLQIHTFEYKGTARYIRALSTVSGGPGTGATIGILVVRGNPKSAT